LGVLSEARVGLRFRGDDLDPDEISQLLGCQPTRGQRKGEGRVLASGKTVIAKTGGWQLDATIAKPGDLDAQVTELLSQLTTDLSVWSQLTARYAVDLFCGFFMEGGDEGLVVDASTLAELGARGIELGLCLYGPDSDES